MTRIFVSYRREDAGGHARHLFDTLASRFGRRRVFMDVAGIDAGEDFVARIDREVGRCDVFLALIGKRWLSVTDDSGGRRIDEDNDYVRREIAAALSRDIKTIPILLDGASMPAAGELPDEIAGLATRNAAELTSARWESDLDRLFRLLPTPPRRWLVRSAAALVVLACAALGALYAHRLVSPPPEPMSGIFNVAVMDFGQRTAEGGGLDASRDGEWLADEIYEGLDLEEQSSARSVVDIARLPRHAGGDRARELERNLVRISDAVNATVVIHGFLDVAAPPYHFAPLLYVTDEFNGGEELTGASAFGSPIEFALPLRTGEGAAQNRLALKNALEPRLRAMSLFTLGLGYLQIDENEQALKLFERAGDVGGWEGGQEVLHLFRGSALFKLDRSGEARAAYEQAVEASDGEYGRAFVGLGNLFFQNGFVERAAAMYRRAAEAGRNSPLAHVEAKAGFNLGLALASRARALNEACSADDARAALDRVRGRYDRDQGVDKLRELAFKAHYQSALLQQSCARTQAAAPGNMTEHLTAAVEHLEQALELARPTPIRSESWFDVGRLFEKPRVAERPWQKDRWVAWHLLGYCELRLAELGEADRLAQAVDSLRRVTTQYERRLGDISQSLAAEAYSLLARALEHEDPAAARDALTKANALANPGGSDG